MNSNAKTLEISVLVCSFMTFRSKRVGIFSLSSVLEDILSSEPFAWSQEPLGPRIMEKTVKFLTHQARRAYRVALGACEVSHMFGLLHCCSPSASHLQDFTHIFLYSFNNINIG